jgi:hypothetical protein
MPSYARAGWICFESEVGVEAAKSVPYRRLMLRAVQVSSEVYTSCGGEGLRCNVLYPRRSLNFQYSDRVKPLEVLTSLWIEPMKTAPLSARSPKKSQETVLLRKPWLPKLKRIHYNSLKTSVRKM